MTPEVRKKGLYSRHEAAICEFARSEKLFCRETSQGLSQGQVQTLRTLLQHLDNVTLDKRRRFEIVGFGGTGKNQLLRILDTYFNDRAHHTNLEIFFATNHAIQVGEPHVTVISRLPFTRPHDSSEVTIIDHKGFNAEELSTRLSLFGINNPDRWLCETVASYGFGSFPLALGHTMSGTKPHSPTHAVLKEGIPWGSFEDSIARNLLEFHPTTAALAQHAPSVSAIETSLEPFIPDGASRSALPTMRRVLRDDTTPAHIATFDALHIPSTSYASFNKLAAQILKSLNSTTPDHSAASLHITASLPIEVAFKIDTIRNDYALSHESRLLTVISILNAHRDTFLPSESACITQLPPFSFKMLLEHFGMPRLTLLLGVLFETLQNTRPQVSLSAAA